MRDFFKAYCPYKVKKNPFNEKVVYYREVLLVVTMYSRPVTTSYERYREITPLFQNKEHIFANYSPDTVVTQE